jgi:REP element-mobilizing transposase RayT
MELHIRDLSKTYANGVHALKDVTLTISQGMFGLLVPNGADRSPRRDRDLRREDTLKKVWGRVKESPSVFRLLMGMSRHLRFIPDGGALVEVTCRTVQGRLLLVPSPQLNDIVLGVLGRAQRLHPVEVVAYAFASNHWHALLRVENAKQLSDFMCYLNGNLAKEVGRRTGWKEKVWGRRYQAIVISEEEEMQVARLRYILSHGVKEGLVARVEEWPGCIVRFL